MRSRQASRRRSPDRRRSGQGRARRAGSDPIVLRLIGSPLPLGFFTVAIDNVLVSTLQWGLLPVADRRAVALIVFPAFIVQAIAGLFALSARDSIAGTLMLSFATTWLIDALVFFVNPPGAAAALGVFYVVFAVFISFMLAARYSSVS